MVYMAANEGLEGLRSAGGPSVRRQGTLTGGAPTEPPPCEGAPTCRGDLLLLAAVHGRLFQEQSDGVLVRFKP